MLILFDKMKYLYILLIVLLIPIASFANEYSIGYAPICKHFNNDPALNEVNHGVFLEYNQWTVGTFNNSGRNQSYFLGRDFRTDKRHLSSNSFYRWNLYLGVLYGYGDDIPNIEGWTLGIAPTFEIGYLSFSMETMVNPFADGGVVSFLFKYTWSK